MSKNLTNYTAADLKIAYQLVQQDLFNSLLKAKDGEQIRLGQLGKFTKTEQGLSSPKYGNHIYYKLTFCCFSKLKRAFHEQLSRKYRSK